MAVSLPAAAVFVSFIGLGVLLKLAQHNTKDITYNPICPMVIVSLGKLLTSFFMYLFYDGSIKKLVKQFWNAGPLIRNYFLVAGSYCLYDVLGFVNSGLFDPQTFLVLLQLRIVTTALVWEMALKKPSSWVKRVGLVLISIGCAIKQAGGSVYNPHDGATSWRYIFIALQVGFNSFAAVANEVLLKERGELPLNAHNMVQYSWTIFLCLLVGVLAPVEGVGYNPLDLEVWRPMLDWRLFPSILILVSLGLVTSAFLKWWDSVWKCVATSIELFMTGFASSAVFGYPIRLSDLLALAVTTGGIWLFAQPTLFEKLHLQLFGKVQEDPRDL